MKLLNLVMLPSLVIAITSTSNSGSTSTTSMSPDAALSTSTSPPYSITALPAVKSAPSCIFNCLIPIGLADPSGCDDVTEDCACLSAPADVLDFLTGCVNTVCKSSTEAFGSSATGLYESYCKSVYGSATFSQAFVAESSADAAAASSSTASADASTTSPNSSTASPSASTSVKSDSCVWSPSLLAIGIVGIGGLVFGISL